VLLVVAAPVWGFQLKSGNAVTIPAGETVADDVYAFAANVSVAGDVKGDLVASGSQVSVSGPVSQDVVLAGGTVEVSGKTGDDLWLAGGNVRAAGPVAEDAMVTGGTVILAREAKIGRDLAVAGGQLTVDSSVGRDLKISGGTCAINGSVGGSVTASCDSLTVGPGAVIKGDLVYTSAKKPEISPTAKIMGRTIAKPLPARPARKCAFGCKAGFWFLRFAMLLVVGLVVIGLAPRAAERSADAVFGGFWLALLVGFIFLTVVPIAATIIMCTVLGLPLGMILLAAYLISVYVSRAFVGLAIGRWLFRRLGRESVSPYLGLLVGLIILWLLIAIPFVGWLIHLLALLLGFGAVAIARHAMMKDLRAEGKI
jgi:cytoskeletal protein CcmA (bactofilin family)